MYDQMHQRSSQRAGTVDIAWDGGGATAICAICGPKVVASQCRRDRPSKALEIVLGEEGEAYQDGRKKQAAILS